MKLSPFWDLQGAKKWMCFSVNALGNYKFKVTLLEGELQEGGSYLWNKKEFPEDTLFFAMDKEKRRYCFLIKDGIFYRRPFRSGIDNKNQKEPISTVEVYMGEGTGGWQAIHRSNPKRKVNDQEIQLLFTDNPLLYSRDFPAVEDISLPVPILEEERKLSESKSKQPVEEKSDQLVEEKNWRKLLEEADFKFDKQFLPLTGVQQQEIFIRVSICLNKLQDKAKNREDYITALKMILSGSLNDMKEENELYYLRDAMVDMNDARTPDKLNELYHKKENEPATIADALIYFFSFFKKEFQRLGIDERDITFPKIVGSIYVPIGKFESSSGVIRLVNRGLSEEGENQLILLNQILSNHIRFNEIDYPKFYECFTLVNNILSSNLIGELGNVIQEYTMILRAEENYQAISRMDDQLKKIQQEIFLTACEKGYLTIVESQIENGFDVNQLSGYPEAKSPLHSACENGSYEIVELLLKKGANIALKTNRGRTPLEIVCETNNQQILEILISNDNTISKIGVEYGQLFFNACQTGSLEMVNFLLTNSKLITSNTNVNVSEILKSNEIFHQACCDNNLEIIQILLENGANVNQIYSGETPLGIAIKNKRQDIVEELIKKGADVKQLNDFNETPLEIAIENNQLQLVGILLYNGADPKVKPDLGRTLLHEACENGDLEIVKLLLEKQVNANEKNEVTGKTPLSIACIRNDLELIDTLILGGADINTWSSYGFPLEIAYKAQNIDLMKALIARGADPKKKRTSIEAFSLFDTVILDHDLNVLELFLKVGINVNEVNSAVHTAVEYNETGLLNLLIKYGADLNKKNNKGETPFFIALSKFSDSSHDKLIKILIVNGACLKTFPSNINMAQESFLGQPFEYRMHISLWRLNILTNSCIQQGDILLAMAIAHQALEFQQLPWSTYKTAVERDLNETKKNLSECAKLKYTYTKIFSGFLSYFHQESKTDLTLLGNKLAVEKKDFIKMINEISFHLINQPDDLYAIKNIVQTYLAKVATDTQSHYRKLLVGLSKKQPSEIKAGLYCFILELDHEVKTKASKVAVAAEIISDKNLAKLNEQIKKLPYLDTIVTQKYSKSWSPFGND